MLSETGMNEAKDLRHENGVLVDRNAQLGHESVMLPNVKVNLNTQ